MNRQQHARRRFLVAALTLAGGAAAHGPLILSSGRAWAEATTPEGARAVLVRIARLLYPHDALGEDVYAEVLDQAMAMIADDAQFHKFLQDAEAALQKGGSASFVDASPDRQIAALQSVEKEPFFAGIQMAVANRLYSHPGVWTMLGYEGPSWQKGGWLERGSGDIDWLPGAGS